MTEMRISWKFHLSTLLCMIFVCGVLLMLNVYHYSEESYREEPDWSQDDDLRVAISRLASGQIPSNKDLVKLAENGIYYEKFSSNTRPNVMQIWIDRARGRTLRYGWPWQAYQVEELLEQRLFIDSNGTPLDLEDFESRFPFVADGGKTMCNYSIAFVVLNVGVAISITAGVGLVLELRMCQKSS